MNINEFNRLPLGPEGHVIILAKPVSELLAHIGDCQLPPFILVTRAVKVIALSIFRWHLCDYILFPDNYSFCHNINGKVTTTNKKTLMEKYPYIPLPLQSYPNRLIQSPGINTLPERSVLN